MVEEGKVIGVHSVEQWKEHFDNGKDSKKLVVLDFTATWCGPCRFIAPILEDIAKQNPNVIFIKADVDELSSVAEEWGVEVLPTFLFLKDGEVKDKVVGAKKEELLATIAKHA